MTAAIASAVLVAAITTIAPGPARAVTTDSGTYNLLGPRRVLDTRAGTQGPIAGGHTRSLAMTNFGVPLGASAVVLNVTVTNPKAAGHLTVFADGTALPNASNLNFVANQTVPNLVVAPVGANGKVDLYNGSPGRIDVIVDLSGFYTGGTPSAAGAFGALAPARLLDTRHTGAIGSGGIVRLHVLGVGGVPQSGLSAIVLNVTVTAPTANGYITVWGDGPNRPNVSNLNFVHGQTVPNLVVTQVGADGYVDLYNGSGGTVQLIGDVFGYYLTGPPTVHGSFGAVPPQRVLDTRGGHTVAPGGSVNLPMFNVGGVPGSNVSAVVLNVTVTSPTAAGYIIVYAGGTTRPTTSNLNFVPNQTVPNLVIAPVGADGSVTLYNGSRGTLNLIADVSGYVVT